MLRGELSSRCGCAWLWRWALLLVWVIAAGACDRWSAYQDLRGATMGTYWRIQCRCDEPVSAGAIGDRLEALNAVFSTYDPASELSRLNQTHPEQWTPVSAELLTVLEAAAVLHQQSGGAFDPTVGALVDLWGFGAAEVDASPDAPLPDPGDIEIRRGQIGFAALEIDANRGAVRFRAPRHIDLSALAKGRAVDVLAADLTELGCSDWLVDIGGELKVAGARPGGGPWRLGIEQPGRLRPGSASLPVLRLTQGSVATSGDYLNYRETDGQRYSHLIDPRTGYPIRHRLASVTVWHDSAMLADGWATALNVLGTDAGRALAERATLSVAGLVRRDDGFAVWSSSAFDRRFRSDRQQRQE